jgi:hypothetical protein
MYKFCRTSDLGKMIFYFSCKNWSSKVYTSFVKVVVLDLKLILRKQFRGFHSPTPWKKSSFAIGSLGAASSGDRQNPAKGGSGWAGKWPGMMRDSPRIDLRGWRRREVLQRESSAVAVHGGRWELRFGEIAARSGKPVARECSSGAGGRMGEL